MIDINKYRDFVKFLSNKNGEGAYESTPEFNLNAERAVMEFTMKRFGNVHEYTPGRPAPIIGFEASQKVMDDLRHLKENRPLNVVDGLAHIPDGVAKDAIGQVAPKYLHLSRLFYWNITMANGIASKRRIGFKVLKDKEVDDILESHIVPPTFDHPYMNIEGSYMRVYPEELTRVELTYLRIPTPPVWGFTVVNNREVYDTATSSNVDAPDEAMNEIVMMHLSYLGIHLREQELIAYSEQAKRAGV